MTVNRFAGYRQAGASTHTFPLAANASTARARQPARSAGVWVTSASEAAYSPSQSGNVHSGKDGRPVVVEVSGVGSGHSWGLGAVTAATSAVTVPRRLAASSPVAAWPSWRS